MKKLLLATATLAITSAAPLAAQAQDVSVSTSIDYVSEYVFRGVTLAETAIQPGVEVAVGDFAVGAWFSTGVGETSVFAGDEVDLYASYGFGLSELISGSVGITYYHYPQGGGLFSTNDGASGTYEVSAGLGFDTLLAPSLTAYYDLTLDNFTLEGGVGHSFPVAEKTSFDLSLTAGLVDVDDGESYEYGVASAGLSYAFTDAVSVYGNLNYGLSSEDTFADVSIDLDATEIEDLFEAEADDNSLWFGLGISAGF